MDYEVDSEDEWEEEPEDGEQLSVGFPAIILRSQSVACCSRHLSVHDRLGELSAAEVGVSMLCMEPGST